MTAFSSADTAATRLVAGLSVPDTPLVSAALEYAQRISDPYLFNHAVRSWLFAELTGRTNGIAFDREVVAVGTLLHDIGLTESVPGPHRFEVNGDAVAGAAEGTGSRRRHDGDRRRL